MRTFLVCLLRTWAALATDAVQSQNVNTLAMVTQAPRMPFSIYSTASIQGALFAFGNALKQKYRQLFKNLLDDLVGCYDASQRILTTRIK